MLGEILANWSSLVCWLAGWLAGLLAGWLAGLLAGWLAGMMTRQINAV
jgi:fructose-specific phosphotransferase system IIC component